MKTAKLAKKPYLKISKSLYDEIAKTGKKTVKISIHPNGQNGNIAKKRRPSAASNKFVHFFGNLDSS